MTTIAFVDCETNHLDADLGDAWEVAVILRNSKGDTEHLWQIRPDVAKADPESLRIGGYPRRFIVPEHAESAFVDPDGRVHPAAREWTIGEIWTALNGALLVGSNPGFDDRFLRKLIGGAPWHYRPVDIATLVAGTQLGLARVLRQFGYEPSDSDLYDLPFSSRALSKWIGVEPPAEGVAHTALGDARWARDVYDAVMGGAA